jgi:Zn-dependent peptidase ImmA (M78 family)
VSGFAIADVILPTIGITQTDTPPTRRIFSILHEFAHLLLRQSGISDLDVDASRPPEDQRIEVFCNHVAAAVLIPKESLIAEKLLRENNFGKEDWPDEAIKQLALNYSVSREAFVRRLLTFDLVNRDFYEKKRTQYNEEYQQKKQIERERAKLEGRKIVKFPARDAINQLGRPLVGMILDSYYRDRLSLSDVSGFLGIRTRHLNKLEALVRAGKRL